MKYFVIFLILIRLEGNSQAFYPAFEIGAGKIIPNYPGHPSSPFNISFGASLYQSSVNKVWGQYFRNPESGLTIRLAYLGNNDVLGNQLSIYPFANFQLTKKSNPLPLYLKLGMGLAIFNKPYDSVTNRENQVMGSMFSWHFNATFYKTILKNAENEFRLGLGYYHASNGHIQIPNYGLNAFLLSGEVLFNKSTRTFSEQTKIDSAKSYWVIEQRIGVGIHELAGTTSPVGGPKYGVFTTGFNIGYIPKNHIKWKVGMIGRYYTSFYQYQSDNNQNPSFLDASCIYVMVGSEFYLGHIGLDAELGFILYRPFFREFYDKFISRSERDYFLKNLINNRLGINYYLLNPYSRPKWNIKMGCHINANFGQADFSDMTLGLVYRLN